MRGSLRWYIDNFATVSKWQRTKQAQLEFLEHHPIGESNALSLTSSELINHVRARRAGGAGPATVGNDLTWIGVVLRAAQSVCGMPVKPDIVHEARSACRELRLVAKSRRRDRRPTAEELVKLDEHFNRRDHRSMIPMRDIFWFAIHSARREAEICRLERRDTYLETRTGLLRDAKHPTAKEGNHKRFKLTPEASAILERQPKKTDYFFPYDPKSISSAFTRAYKLLGIPNLRFHDLRHEATSRLFERGYQIHEVAQFTCRESWNELKRYTNPRPETLRELPNTSPPPASNGSKNGKPTQPIAFSSPLHADDRSARPSRSH